MGDIYNNMIRSLFTKGDMLKYSHLIIVVDKSDMEFVKIFVKRSDDVKDVLFNIVSNPIYEIKEIYNYDMNLEKQIAEARAYHINTIYNKMDEALLFAAEKHKGQTRMDGSPYINHPIIVADNVKNYFSNHPRINELITSAYLHDTLEDTNTTIDEIRNNFGDIVAHLVIGVTSDEDKKKRMGKTNYLCDKMLNMDDDTLNLKLCDRLANVLDLNNAPNEFVDKYISEILIIMNYLVSNRTMDSIKLKIIKEINMHINSLRKSKILKLFLLS